MALIPESEVREVLEITTKEKQRIMDFLQGAVYCWCKNRHDDWFSMRDLTGSDNYFWDGSPLQVLFIKYERRGKIRGESIDDVSKDSGWILKKVINDDKRLFETKKEELIRKYRWIK